MEEIWKPLKQNPDYYEISNLGRIRSLCFTNQWGTFIRKEPKIIKPVVTQSGYCVVTICSAKRKRYYVHRLVATNFIDNPMSLPQINHKNGIKTDNNIDNLEWSTSSDNIKHSFRVLKRRPNLTMLGKTFDKNPNHKKIAQYSITGKLIRIWKCELEAVKILGANKSGLSMALHGKCKTCKGYMWKFI